MFFLQLYTVHTAVYKTRPRCFFCFLIDRNTSPLPLMAQFDRPEEETDILPLLTEMVGSCLPCLSCFFTCSSVLLLAISLRGMYTSTC